MKARCEFDKSDGCHALACYSRQKCSARDRQGNPKYVTLDRIKKDLKEKME